MHCLPMGSRTDHNFNLFWTSETSFAPPHFHSQQLYSLILILNSFCWSYIYASSSSSSSFPISYRTMVFWHLDISAAIWARNVPLSPFGHHPSKAAATIELSAVNAVLSPPSIFLIPKCFVAFHQTENVVYPNTLSPGNQEYPDSKNYAFGYTHGSRFGLTTGPLQQSKSDVCDFKPSVKYALWFLPRVQSAHGCCILAQGLKSVCTFIHGPITEIGPNAARLCPQRL